MASTGRNSDVATSEENRHSSYHRGHLYREGGSSNREHYGSVETSDFRDADNSLSQEKSNLILAATGARSDSHHDKELEPHLGSSRQYWRDIILGVNDGLMSTFLLVTGVAGGGLSSTDILLTAIAGAIAGAVSMCAGEYVATKSQNEVLQGELNLEKRHIEHSQESELEELRSGLLQIIGISSLEQQDLVERLVEHYKRDSRALLKIMTALEFGVLDQEVRCPIKAGLFSCMLFFVGAVPSIIPFIFLEPLPGLITAAVTATLALLVVGAVKTWATRGNCAMAAMENLFIAGFGGAFAYGVGASFDAIIHTESEKCN